MRHEWKERVPTLMSDLSCNFEIICLQNINQVPNVLKFTFSWLRFSPQFYTKAKNNSHTFHKLHVTCSHNKCTKKSSFSKLVRTLSVLNPKMCK